ncbi:hypothetical protein GCM10018954_050070 [Kutzneria kofuensis]
MSPIVTVSLAAFDILWEELRLGSTPYPFQIPSYGETYEERSRIRAAVHADLEERGVTERGRVAQPIAAAMALVARPHIQLDTISTVDVRDASSSMLRAAAAARGRDAVLMVQEGQMVRLEWTRDTALAASIISLLPPTKAGPGQEISLRRRAWWAARAGTRCRSRWPSRGARRRRCRRTSRRRWRPCWSRRCCGSGRSASACTTSAAGCAGCPA